MILSDADIFHYVKSGKLKIEPFNEEFLGPCSYDVTLGNEFIYYKEWIYNTKKELRYVKMKVDNGLLLCPRTFSSYHLLRPLIKFATKNNLKLVIGSVLGTTNEYIELPKDLCAVYQGRSSLGRLFLTSHATAGFIDAGFKGKITLEITAHDMPVILYPGMRIGQLIFLRLNSECKVGYSERKSSKYTHQKSVTPSLIHEDFSTF